MKNRIREARENETGFTLVELLIVIVILGILAGVAVFGIANFQATARNNACQENLASVSTAINAYTVYNNGTAPLTQTNLVGSYIMAPFPTNPNYPGTALVVGTCN